MPTLPNLKNANKCRVRCSALHKSLGRHVGTYEPRSLAYQLHLSQFSEVFLTVNSLLPGRLHFGSKFGVTDIAALQFPQPNASIYVHLPDFKLVIWSLTHCGVFPLDAVKVFLEPILFQLPTL